MHFVIARSFRPLKFPENSKLQIIGDKALNGTAIECFTIVPSIKQIGENAFAHCHKLRIIEVMQNDNRPSVCENAFQDCEKLIIMIPPKMRDLFNNL